jgi:hypothetical protein
MAFIRIILSTAALCVGVSAVATTSTSKSHSKKSIVDVITGAVEEVKEGIMGSVRSEVDDDYGDEMKQMRDEARTSPHVRKVGSPTSRRHHHRDVVTNLNAHQRELLDEHNRGARSNGDVRMMLGLKSQTAIDPNQPKMKYHHEQYIANGHIYQYSVPDGPVEQPKPQVLANKKQKHHKHKDHVVDEWDVVAEKDNEDHEDDAGEVLSYTDVKADTDGEGNHEELTKADQDRLRHLHVVRAKHELTAREKLRQALDLTKNMHNRDEEALVQEHQARLADQEQTREAREVENATYKAKLARNNGAAAKDVFMGPHPGAHALPGGRVNQYVKAKPVVQQESPEDAEYKNVVSRAQTALL